VNLFEERGSEKLRRALRIRAGLHGSAVVSAEPRPGEERVNPDDGQTYVWIPPGEFPMGCSPGDQEGFDHEKPAHKVRIARGFWLGQTPVTVGAYRHFAESTGVPMPVGGPQWKDSDQPMVAVTWEEAKRYCEVWAKGRLLTEAEWEYAARATTTGPRYGELVAIAWHADNSGDRIHPVKQKQPNAWGLFDMLGSVWEWVADWYEEGYYGTLPSMATDPQGPPSGTYRVLRGGSWDYSPRFVRASDRSRVVPGLRGHVFGFRCARELLSL
jgi:formylglycine-generating enzyme required for sulfatase activity